jgi:hypothetical protein
MATFDPTEFDLPLRIAFTGTFTIDTAPTTPAGGA